MQGKTIVLGVSGGIAAYKACELASRLTQSGARVHVVMTQAATRFIAPLTFEALTHQPVHTSLWPDAGEQAASAPPNSQPPTSNLQYAAMAHIALADSADAVLIAPASADVIARLAHGLADDLLTTLVLATRAPVLVAPAMNPTMLAHSATQKNLATLRELGYIVIEPESGRMACEHVGSGRLPETDVLIQALPDAMADVGARHALPLHGKMVLVTAGPTREALDPVRFLSNRSSGKMGYAIAAEATRRGARVLLVSGPTRLQTPPGVARHDVLTTQQMFDVVTQHAPECDIVIAAAAPADYRLANVAERKIKKTKIEKSGAAEAMLRLELVPTPDIIAQVGHGRKPHQIVVGFAAETGNELDEARRKLRDKNLDALVFNDVTQPDAGFDTDTNRVVWITRDSDEAWPLLSKDEVAARLWNAIESIAPGR